MKSEQQEIEPFRTSDGKAVTEITSGFAAAGGERLCRALRARPVATASGTDLTPDGTDLIPITPADAN